MIRELPGRDPPWPLAQEVFATTADVYTMTGDLPEALENLDTADGRPRTKHFAFARLARSLCADATTFTHQDATQLVDEVYRTQMNMLLEATSRVLERMPRMPKTILVSGHGDFLAVEVAERSSPHTTNVVSLSQKLGAAVSRCACAHALAVLAQERSST